MSDPTPPPGPPSPPPLEPARGLDGLPLPPPPPPARKGGCLKAALITLAVVLGLGGACTAGMMIWYSRNSDRLESASRVGREEGARAGANLDEKGCLDQARTQTRGVADVEGMLRQKGFVQACLIESRETPGFCEGVPPLSEIRRTLAWRKQGCDNDAMCQQLREEVQTYCLSSARSEKPGATGTAPGPADSAGAAADTAGSF